VGFGILLLGAAIGFFGASTPTSSASQQTLHLIDTSFSVASNDYSAQSLQMTKQEMVQIALSIDNQTMFTFDIMNQSQFYLYNNCAPRCAQPLLGGNGSYYQQAGEVEPVQFNTTVFPSSPYSGQFEAPTNGTYYFVFDNTIGPAWTTYLNQNAAGNTTGHFSLFSAQLVTTRSANWAMVGLGAVITVTGGGAATAMWGTKPKAGRE
jgi:hypothetical protein